MVLLLMAKVLHHLEILKLYEPLRILGLTTTHCCSFSQRSCCALFTPLPQACQGTKLPMAWYSKNRSMGVFEESKQFKHMRYRHLLNEWIILHGSIFNTYVNVSFLVQGDTSFPNLQKALTNQGFVWICFNKRFCRESNLGFGRINHGFPWVDHSSWLYEEVCDTQNFGCKLCGPTSMIINPCLVESQYDLNQIKLSKGSQTQN